MQTHRIIPVYTYSMHIAIMAILQYVAHRWFVTRNIHVYRWNNLPIRCALRAPIYAHKRFINKFHLTARLSMGSGHLVDVMSIDVKTRWNSQPVDRTIKIIVVLVSLTNGYKWWPGAWFIITRNDNVVYRPRNMSKSGYQRYMLLTLPG